MLISNMVIDTLGSEVLQCSGGLFLRGELVASLPSKTVYTSPERLAIYSDPRTGPYYANDPLPIEADTAEITIEHLYGAQGIAKTIIFMGEGKEIPLSFPGVADIETREVVLEEKKPVWPWVDFLPQEPWNGPPFPKFLKLFWPWHKA